MIQCSHRMDNTFLLLANGNQISNVAPARMGGPSSSNPTSMILVPRPSYSAAVAASNQPSTGAHAAPNFAVKRVPSCGTEIRLIVTNQKDSRSAMTGFVAAQNAAVRHGVASGALNGGFKLQFTGGSSTATLVRSTHSAVSQSTTISNSVASQPSTVQLVAQMSAKNTGSVVNGTVWNAVSVVDANGAKAGREVASSPSELIIQIRPEQFRQLVGCLFLI